MKLNLNWRVFVRPLYLVALIFLVSNMSSVGQVKKKFLIDESKPGVSIEFDRMGSRTPIQIGESAEGYWLKLRNNLTSKLFLCTVGVDEDGITRVGAADYEQTAVEYDVLRIKSDKRQLPGNRFEFLGGPFFSMCNDTEIPAGGVFRFSVPTEHLRDGLQIRIRFRYEWEIIHENETEHFIYFGSYQLPRIKD